MLLNDKYWNQRYLDQNTAWDVGFVSTPLKQYFDGLEDKNMRILIPGAGNSYEAEYLKRKGFENVFVCDFAEQPLLNLQKRCPLFRKSELMLCDFFTLSGTYDLIIEQTFFCALDPSRRQEYFKKMHSLLPSGGKLAGLLFDCVFDSSPPFGGNMDEYKKYFKGLFSIEKFEKCFNSIEPRRGREIFMILCKK